jgi:hypothetical protein
VFVCYLKGDHAGTRAFIPSRGSQPLCIGILTSCGYDELC